MAAPGTGAIRETMLMLMSTLSAKIVTTSLLADELAEAADEVTDPCLAAAMLDHARRYRIEVLEVQGELAVLSTGYAWRFQMDL